MNPPRLTDDQRAALRWRKARAAASRFDYISFGVGQIIVCPGRIVEPTGWLAAYICADATAIDPLVAEEADAELDLALRLEELGEPIATDDGREVYLNGIGEVRERSAHAIEPRRRPSVPAKG